MTWQAHAACRHADPEIFFPVVGENPHRALAICAGCPVAQPCLDEAMEFEALADVYGRYGVYGGLTPRQRTALAQRTARRAS